MTVCSSFSPNWCPGPPRAHVDVRAFARATILTPLIVAASGVLLLGFGLVITVPAAVLSLPGFALCGLPAAWIAISRFPRPEDGTASVWRVVMAGLVANVLLVPVTTLVLAASGPNDFEQALGVAWGYSQIGFLVAPIEAMIFAYVYRAAAREQGPVVHVDVFE